VLAFVYLRKSYLENLLIKAFEVHLDFVVGIIQQVWLFWEIDVEWESYLQVSDKSKTFRKPSYA